MIHSGVSRKRIRPGWKNPRPLYISLRRWARNRGTDDSQMFEISQHLRLALSELRWTFVRSGGPGGQNVNKVASKAVLRWNVDASPGLSEEIKARLRSQQKNRLTGQGDLVISSQRFRDQER